MYEIGYHLRRDHWGQGLATEAARACREWGFAHLKVDRLISLIPPENTPSQRVAERNGMPIWKEVGWRGLRHYVYAVERAGVNPLNKLSS
ncbi:MAG: GNAT family N-acetyltransferase [Terriglobales bacterium]